MEAVGMQAEMHQGMKPEGVNEDITVKLNRAANQLNDRERDLIAKFE